jgi:hypothetical protein
MTPIIQKSQFDFRYKDGSSKKPRKGQAAQHKYREDTPRRAPKWTFLGRGPIRHKLNEDNLAIVAIVIVAAAKPSGTYEISGM